MEYSNNKTSLDNKIAKDNKITDVKNRKDNDINFFGIKNKFYICLIFNERHSLV